MDTIFEYAGREFLNCGPNSGQKSALAADSNFRTTLQSSYGTDFSESQHIFNDLVSSAEAIYAKGPEQEGMSPQEKAAENSQAINAAAASNKNVQVLIGEKAAMTGATPGVESGVTEATRANAAVGIENNLANKQAGITEKSYEIGRENYNNAGKTLIQAPAATMDPTNQAAGEAIGAEKAASDQANENAAASSSWMGVVGGLAGSLGGAAIGVACVTLDTNIHFLSELVLLAQDIVRGDSLEGMNGPERVLSVEGSYQPCVALVLESGKTIEVSESHTFVNATGGYVEAVAAQGRFLHTVDGPDEVVSVSHVGEKAVLKIKLSNVHAYITNGIWSLE
jgi:hypothetical protein